jgi:hypothetical protein
MRFLTIAVIMVRRSTGSAVAHDQAPPRIVPIASLNHYQSRWTIKARVTQKGAKRAYSNARGDGKVFSAYSYRHSMLRQCNQWQLDSTLRAERHQGKSAAPMEGLSPVLVISLSR